MRNSQSVIKDNKQPKHPREKSLHGSKSKYPIFELYRQTQKGVFVEKWNNREQFLNGIRQLSRFSSLRKMWFVVRYGKGRINESVKYTNRALCLISARIFSNKNEVQAVMDDIEHTSKKREKL